MKFFFIVYNKKIYSKPYAVSSRVDFDNLHKVSLQMFFYPSLPFTEHADNLVSRNNMMLGFTYFENVFFVSWLAGDVLLI